MTGPVRRVAVVTGGAGAIGASVAAALTAADHQVVIMDRTGDVPVDLADEGQVRAAAQRVLDQAGRCDVLVHAAAAFDRADLARLDLVVWRRVQAVNVESALLLAQAFVPGMAARGFGRIIFVVSDTVWAPPAADLPRSPARSCAPTAAWSCASAAERGRVIGLHGVSANGLRAGSGFTVGILGAAIGIHWSLGLSAVALCLGTLAAGIYALRGHAIALPAGPGQGARDRAQHEAGLAQGRQVVHPRHHVQLATGDPGRGLPVGLEKGRIIRVADQQRRRHRDFA